MRHVRWTAVAGIGLIVVGVLFFFENLGLLQVGRIVVPLIFAFGGLSFLYVFLANRSSWWAIIPACALLGLAALMAWEQFGPPGAASWGPAFFLACRVWPWSQLPRSTVRWCWR